MSTMRAEEILDIAKATIEAAKYCHLITLSGSGHAHSRVMQAFGPEEDLTFWFGASPRSRKVREMRANCCATLAFLHAPEAAYVSVHGEATIEEDLELREKYWRELFWQFWPDGPAGDDYVVIRFVPSRIEVMNVQKGVAPDPFGLRPAALERRGDFWVEVDHSVGS